MPTTDSIGWGQLGSTYTFLGSPTPVTSGGGISAIVSDAGYLGRRDSGNGWNGNFAPGDQLLWSVGFGAITVNFGTPVSGAGAQIDADYNGAFTAVITAYGAGNTLLGSESINGNSANTEDGSAVFIGLSSASADITSVVFNLSSASAYPGDFAIDTLDLGTTSPVPDAGLTSELLVMSFLGLGFVRWKLAKA